MSLFFTLLLKIIPLYVIIAIGFWARRGLDVPKEPIAKLLIYVVAPAVVFLGTVEAGLKIELLALPIMFFVIGAVLMLITLLVSKHWWKDGTEKVAAFSAGTGNTGYFGLPVCLALIGDKALPVAVMATLGLIFYESTLGFYVVARSSHTAKDALNKVLRLPVLYAFLLGLSMNIFGFAVHDSIMSVMETLKGAYAPLGMMIIGLSLAGVQFAHHLDAKLTALTFFNKFIVWPMIFLGIIYLDKNYLHWFNDLVYMVFMIESITPIAANTVTYAAELKAHPEKAALIVFVSTLIALIYIPAVVTWLF